MKISTSKKETSEQSKKLAASLTERWCWRFEVCLYCVQLFFCISLGPQLRSVITVLYCIYIKIYTLHIVTRISVQIPQGRIGGHDHLGTYLTTRQRNKDKQEETSKTLHAIYPRTTGKETTKDQAKISPSLA